MDATNPIDARRNQFTAPTGRQVRVYLTRYGLREPSRWLAWGPLLVMTVVIAAALVLEGPLSALAPWVGAGGVLIAASVRASRLRQLDGRVLRAQELTLLRRWRQSLRLSWRLLPLATSLPHLHTRLIQVMAMCLDQIKAYESAIEVYEHLIQSLPPEDPASLQVRINCAIAQLADGRLADADDTLQRVRQYIERAPGSTVSAAYHFARLIQQARTNHWSEAAEGAGGIIDHLRPLGIDAGYGYALTALAFLNRSQGQGQGSPKDSPVDAGSTAEARQWWSRATMLLPQRVLIDRFPELQPLAVFDQADRV